MLIAGTDSAIDTGTVYPYVSRLVGYEPGAGYYVIATGVIISTEEAARLAGGAMYASPDDGVATQWPGGSRDFDEGNQPIEPYNGGLFDGIRPIEFPIGGSGDTQIYTATGAGADTPAAQNSLMPLLLFGGLAFLALRR